MPAIPPPAHRSQPPSAKCRRALRVKRRSGDVAVVGEEVRHPGEGRGHLADQGLVIATETASPSHVSAPVAAQPRAGQGAHPQSRAREAADAKVAAVPFPWSDHRDTRSGCAHQPSRWTPGEGRVPEPGAGCVSAAPPLREPLGEEGLVRLDSLRRISARPYT